MAKIQILGSKDKYDGMFIKDIDKANTKLTFTNNVREAYERSSGYYVQAEMDFLRFHFKDEYPCVAFVKEYNMY